MKTMIKFLKSALTTLCLLLSAPFITAQQAQNASYPDDPARETRPESSRGTVIERTMNNSQIYPGTTRTIQIYIPKQYDGNRPACLLVCLDGAVYYKMTTVMDNLIFTGEMPVTIGVFVNPGVIYDKNGNVVRYNRSNEFDRIDGTFAHFLESEVLPMVENITLEDGRKLKISNLAADRAITGASSGGICCFVSHHPAPPPYQGRSEVSTTWKPSFWIAMRSCCWYCCSSRISCSLRGDRNSTSSAVTSKLTRVLPSLAV